MPNAAAGGYLRRVYTLADVEFERRCVSEVVVARASVTMTEGLRASICGAPSPGAAVHGRWVPGRRGAAEAHIFDAGCTVWWRPTRAALLTLDGRSGAAGATSSELDGYTSDLWVVGGCVQIRLDPKPPPPAPG
uniref:Uncharacterized protein n=1 Tax=Arundo donax TaxID=35708 RepID=A0A0A9BGF7_ARUDO